MRTLSAESRLVLALVTLSAAGGLVAAELVSRRFEAQVEEVGAQAVRGAAEAFAQQQRAEIDKLSATLDAVMSSAELRSAFLAGDRARLQRLAAPTLAVLSRRSHVTHWYFHGAGPAPRVFLRVHRPDLHGDAPERATLRRAAEGAELGAGLELGRTAFALRAVRPWVIDGEVAGFVELAEEIDHFLTALKGRTGDEYGLLVRRQLVDAEAWASAVTTSAQRWNADADTLLVDATTTHDDDLLAWRGDLGALPPDGLLLGEVEHGDRAFMRGIFPLADAGGRRVGALFVIHDFTDHHRAVERGRAWALAITLLATLLTAGLVALLARWLVFRRLAMLQARLEPLTAGRAAAGQGQPLTSPDELGRLESLFERAFEARDGDRPPRPPPG